MKTRLFLIIALVLLTSSLSAQDNKASVSLTAAIYEEEVTGNLDKAVELYLDILNKYPDDRQVAAKTLYHLGLVNEKMGKQKANEYFTRLVNTYPDQTEMVALAKARLAALGGSGGIDRTEVAKRQIWVAGNDSPLSISQDGRYVILSKYDSGDLWLRDLRSGEQKRITREASWVEWTFAYGTPAISPDGKRIAYAWWDKSNGELRLSALDGSSMQVLNNGQDGRRMFTCNWMPDGRQILASSYDRRDDTFRRHIISLPEGTIRDIGQPEPKEVDWGYSSPDGRQIAYGLNEDIFVYDIATEQNSVLVQNPMADKIVDWTPDGSGILFMSNRSGSNDLYLLRIKDGRSQGDPELLRPNLVASSNLRVTRDGRLFQIENTGTANSLIFQVDEQTGKPTGAPSVVEPDFPTALFPGWSSDGKLLYYEIMKAPSREQLLFIRQEASGQAHEIVQKPKLRYWYRPILSPDGKRFAVTGTGENMNFGIFAIDPESGEVTQLVKIATENEAVDPSQNWSPDSKAIFFKVRSPEESEEFIIRRKDLTTGEEKDVYNGIHTREMKISPDGTRFVYFRNDGPTKSHVIGILDLQSGKELELWRVPEAESPEISGLAWAPDGKHVLVTRGLKQGTELWRFPAVGGPGEKLYFFQDMSMGFVMHPSGKRMAITQVRMNYELWVLENFLPK